MTWTHPIPTGARILRSSVAGTALLLAAACPASTLAATLFGLVNTGEIYASANGGTTWTGRAVLPVRDAIALVAGVTSNDLLLATASGSVYRSTDAGTSWTAVGAVPANDITALVTSDGRSLLVTRSGSLYNSLDNGVTWTAIAALPASDVVAAARRSTSWYALTASGSVYSATDAATTWTGVGTLPTSSAAGLVSRRDTLYAITAEGDLFSSGNGGVTFTALSTLSHVGTTGLAVSGTDLVATLGTGEVAATANALTWTWRGVINQLVVRALASDTPTTTGIAFPPLIGDGIRGPYPNPARGRLGLTLDLATTARVTVDVQDVAGRTVQRLMERESLAAGATFRQWTPSGLAPGVYVLVTHAGAARAAHRFVWLGR